MPPEFTFIDLCAGLGGFHLALDSFGGKCVFASELKEDLQRLYRLNFPNTPVRGDLFDVGVEEIPHHDVLCAGFPCQPFSQAGKRQGFEDEQKRGNVFWRISEIIEYHRPQYVFLENVSNLVGHDKGNTWKTIYDELRRLGYEVEERVLSPHQFGMPQHRKRIYIVCVRETEDNPHPLDNFEFPTPTNNKCDINIILDEAPINPTPLKPQTISQLSVWEEFLQECIKHNQPIPKFPIWAMEFGASYEYQDEAPAFQTIENLRGKYGHLGRKITGSSIDECLRCLPNYAQTNKDKTFPDWKKRYIRQNRDFYDRNKEWLDEWKQKILTWKNSHIKLEWNCSEDAEKTLKRNIIQFRASGIRVKDPTYAPALNLVGTQIPIIPWIKNPDGTEGRYLTVREAARLQGMENLDFEGLSNSRIYEALGNAVNVKVVKMIIKNL